MKEHDLIIIGAGPGGYVAALRAAQLGLDVAAIDENDDLGGTCLRVGCIPSKALLESSELFREAGKSFAEHGIGLSGVELDLASMMKRKNRVVGALTKGVASLFEKNGVHRYRGRGRFDGPGRVVVEGSDSEELRADSILIATGSRSAPLDGVEVDEKRIVTSTGALSFDEVPKRLVVIGAGYIGLELGSVWSRLGSEVTVLEYLDRILPGSDAQIAAEAQKLFERQGLRFHLQCEVTAARVDGGECVVECREREPLRCDRVLLAVGRSPNTSGLGLEEMEIPLDDRGRIRVDDRWQTEREGIFAIGDVISGPMLAHKAQEEGVACVEAIVNGHGHVNYDAIPAVVYTHPEIASVGRTQEDLEGAGVEVKTGTFPFRANGRARTLGQVEGFVKLLADARTDRLRGIHILGPRAGDLIAEAVAALEFAASAEDLARTSHAHPTLAEALKEAALAASGRALHY